MHVVSTEICGESLSRNFGNDHDKCHFCTQFWKHKLNPQRKIIGIHILHRLKDKICKYKEKSLQVSDISYLQ